jgi:hypothetical protein
MQAQHSRIDSVGITRVPPATKLDYPSWVVLSRSLTCSSGPGPPVDDGDFFLLFRLFPTFP